jgi:glycosyltransferase involved in cell wall biosynthesis
MGNFQKNPFVSVVIPALNEEKFLPKALESLRKQDYKNFEIIVVDNNSTDKTAEIAKSFGAKVVFEKNKGVGFARQTGFLAAQGEIIATTDADTILPKNWLSEIVKRFQEDENLSAFGGLWNLYSGTLFAKFAVKHFIFLVWKLDKFFSGGWSLPGCNMAVKKADFLKVGGFNVNIKLGEDADLSQKLKSVGKVVLDPNFRVQTSGRRFKDGLFWALFTYAPNGLYRMFFKKHKFQKLPSIRTEKPGFKRIVLPLTLVLIILITSFYPKDYILAKKVIRNKKVIKTINLMKKGASKMIINHGKMIINHDRK